MSPPEIGFLALGLVLGTTAGAALLAVVRPRSPLRPVVRVTITPNALAPRETAAGRTIRAHQLAEPMPGSPDEEAQLRLPGNAPTSPAAGARTTPPSALDSRTRVPFSPAGLPAGAIGVPIVGSGGPAPGPLASAAPVTAATAIAVSGVAEAPSRDARQATLVGGMDGGATQAGVSVRPRPPVAPAPLDLSAAAIAIPVERAADRSAAADAVSPGGIAPAATARRGGGGASGHPERGDAVADPCAADRAASADACTAADAARASARTAADRLRDAHRALADLQAQIDEAQQVADPRRVAAEKERLHARFRAAHGPSTSADEAEAAARDWLTAVSDLNTAARDAARRVDAGNEELRSRAAALEQLDLAASAARIAAERAEDACRAARESLADCEERQRAIVPTPVPPAGEPQDEGSWPGGAEPAYEPRQAEGSEATSLPVVLRVLRGDAGAREHLVAELAAGDPAEAAAWHVRIARFVDAVTAGAIEDGYLDLAEDDPFWRLFSGEEQREIVQALSALGFRYDGMRGFVDGRAPTARDLSLAVGYAGLDRMRIRTWPGEAGLAGLFDGAVVRADLWLAVQADDLSLGRVEAALGARAASLGDLWDAWGRVRPAMLEER